MIHCHSVRGVPPTICISFFVRLIRFLHITVPEWFLLTVVLLARLNKVLSSLAPFSVTQLSGKWAKIDPWKIIFLRSSGQCPFKIGVTSKMHNVAGWGTGWGKGRLWWMCGGPLALSGGWQSRVSQPIAGPHWGPASRTCRHAGVRPSKVQFLAILYLYSTYNVLSDCVRLISRYGNWPHS